MEGIIWRAEDERCSFYERKMEALEIFVTSISPQTTGLL